MAKESDQLSSSAIHRLETGVGAVTVSTLYRYAIALKLPLRELMSFEEASAEAAPSRPSKLRLIALDDARVKAGAFKTLLPFYSLKAAAGIFGGGEAVEPEGWLPIERRHKLDSKMFVARAVGDSMSPDIRSGDLLVFRADPSGTRQGKVVLAQYRGPADPDTGGSYTVKRYSSSKIAESGGSWRHRQITLTSDNPDYEPIILLPKHEADFKIVAEYLFKLSEKGSASFY